MKIHSDSWRVAIATDNSSNRKTGDMIQIWILPQRQTPVDAIQSGHDRVICGDCPLRGKNGQERSCYVNVGQAPQAVARAYKRHGYKGRTVDLTTKPIRLGAYGDPVHIPLPKLREICEQSPGWTGYTHQWRNPALQGYRHYLMASCETAADAELARSMGWRTFRLADAPADGEVECPSERGVQCRDCQLCCGSSKRAKSITIPAHGSGAKFARALTA